MHVITFSTDFQVFKDAEEHLQLASQKRILHYRSAIEKSKETVNKTFTLTLKFLLLAAMYHLYGSLLQFGQQVIWIL